MPGVAKPHCSAMRVLMSLHCVIVADTLFRPSGILRLFFPLVLSGPRLQEEAISFSSFLSSFSLLPFFLISCHFVLHFRFFLAFYPLSSSPFTLFFPPLFPSFLLPFYPLSFSYSSMFRPTQFSVQFLQWAELQQEDVHGFV